MSKIESEVWCPKCKWKGMAVDCEVKHFGDYVGEGTDYDTWGWEEWDDMVCPECETVVEFKDD